MHKLAFGWSAHGGVAGLPGDPVEIESEECSIESKPRCGDSGFAASMATTNDDHIKDLGGSCGDSHASTFYKKICRTSILLNTDS